MRRPTGERAEIALAATLVITTSTAAAGGFIAVSTQLEELPGYKFVVQLSLLVAALTGLAVAFQKVRARTRTVRVVIFGRPPSGPGDNGVPNLADRLDGHDFVVDRLERGLFVVATDVTTVNKRMDELTGLVRKLVGED